MSEQQEDSRRTIRLEIHIVEEDECEQEALVELVKGVDRFIWTVIWAYILTPVIGVVLIILAVLLFR